MTNRLFVLNAYFVAVLSFPAFALDCEKVMNTLDINACGQIELKKLDKELTQTYKMVLAKFDKISKEPTNIADKSKLKQSLIDAQRLWVKFRDADCNTTYTLWSDGTIRGQMYLGCMKSKTEQRIKELKEYNEYADES
jgi:uncharacterized protein YecT (DUF1311 family)